MESPKAAHAPRNDYGRQPDPDGGAEAQEKPIALHGEDQPVALRASREARPVSQAFDKEKNLIEPST